MAVLIIVGFKGKIKSHNREFREEMEETSAKVMEMVEMIPVTKAHAMEDKETEKMERQLKELLKRVKAGHGQTYFHRSAGWHFRFFRCSVWCLLLTWRGKS